MILPLHYITLRTKNQQSFGTERSLKKVIVPHHLAHKDYDGKNFCKHVNVDRKVCVFRHNGPTELGKFLKHLED